MAATPCVTLANMERAAAFLAAVLLAASSTAASPDWDPWKDEAPPARDAEYSPRWLDARMSGETNPAKLAGLAAIRLYQIALSPGLASRCQFHPSCSRYAFGAIASRGFLNGVIMGAERLSRCNGRAHLQGYEERGEDGLLEDPLEGKPTPLPWLSALGL